MECVFDNPVHANGGCIFADPTAFLVEDRVTRQYRDFWKEYYDDRAIREDEEMLILVRAFIEILHRWH